MIKTIGDDASSNYEKVCVTWKGEETDLGCWQSFCKLEIVDI